MINGVAEFKDYHAEILAKLESGEVIHVYTAIKTKGFYKQWTEQVYNYQTEIMSDEYPEDDYAEIIYPAEWEFVDPERQKYINEIGDTYGDLKEIVEIKNVDWQVDEDTIRDFRE